ncbi:MAG: DUF481 domain-containing protein [Phycisphaeraceae bacterium]|nr:MAG: DUF481 domain-containing protein [Phycisphaeraceae bacterium]
MFLKLDTSEVVVGTVTAVQRDFIVLQSDVFGEIRVPRSRIVSARGFDPDSPMTAEEVEEFIDLPEEAPAAPVAAPAEVPEEKPAVVWENRFEAGLTGSEGNSQNVNFSALLSLQRTTSRDEVLSLTNYRYTQTEREDTANRFDTLLRYDWRFAEGSPWSLFGQGQYEYDQFQDWDYRVSLFGGVGYRLIENETTTLRVRAGAGASREFGGGNDAWEPEGLIGFDLAHQLAKNQRITAYGTLFPSLDDFGEFRSVSGAAYEIDLTDNGDLALRLGAEHRYDTQPGDAKRSDLDYFARVVFKF